MNRRQLQERLRAEAIEEARRDDEAESQVARTLRKWKRATLLVGSALLACTVGVIPFLAGEPLHYKWEAIGKKVLLLTMALYPVFIYTVAHTFIFWKYLGGSRKIHKKYAPPGSKYRTGKEGGPR